MFIFFLPDWPLCRSLYSTHILLLPLSYHMKAAHQQQSRLKKFAAMLLKLFAFQCRGLGTFASVLVYTGVQRLWHFCPGNGCKIDFYSMTDIGNNSFMGRSLRHLSFKLADSVIYEQNIFVWLN